MVMQILTVLTDIAEVQAALQHNIDLNPQLTSLVSSQVLDWHSPADFIQYQVEGQEDCTTLHHSGRDEFENTHLSSNSISGEQDYEHLHFQREKPTIVLRSQCENASCVHDVLDLPDNNHGRSHVAEQGSRGRSKVGKKWKVERSSRLLVLAADCVWVEDLVLPFVRALEAVCSLCDESVVLFAHKERSRKVDQVLIAALQHEFMIEDVPELAGERRGSIRLMRFRLKCGKNREAYTG
jgi:hypothetical protein